MVRGSPDKNTPPFSCDHVNVVDFEGDLVLGARNSGAKILAHQAVLPGAEHDDPVVQHVVDRKHRGAERAGISDPADAARGDQPQALALIQVLQHRFSIAPCVYPSRSATAWPPTRPEHRLAGCASPGAPGAGPQPTHRAAAG